MADIEVRRTHALGIAAARRAAKGMAQDLERRFGLQGRWAGDVLHFERPGVTGTLTVGARELHLSASLGLMLRAMKGSIERAVGDEMDALVASAGAGKPAKPKPARKKR
jgi:putative polyhydroxyalkanoate system protein